MVFSLNIYLDPRHPLLQQQKADALHAFRSRPNGRGKEVTELAATDPLLGPVDLL